MHLFLVLAAFIAPPRTPITNVRIAENGNEPSICISRKDPKTIFAGCNLDFEITSSDGGQTWSQQRLTSPYGVAGDPALTSDADGNLYYVHLANTGGDGWLDRIVCQKSTDGGKTWTQGSFMGNNHPADQDKAWPVAHPSKPWVYVTWTQFDKYGSRNPDHHSNILFSMSKDAGDTWSESMKINDLPGDCLDGDNTTEGATPAVDSDGTIYVAWSNQGKIFLNRSKDGVRWLPKNITVCDQIGGWDMEISGINRANGMPILVVDNSASKNKGTLYIVFADQRAGAADTDVFCVRSTDKGQTWTKPLRVNRDKRGNQNFSPWFAIDETTGNLYVVYYDRRNYTDDQTDVFLAYSTDGAKTFTERKISERPFLPRKDRFFGDYTNISAHAGKIAAIWGRMDNGMTSIWGAIFGHADLKQ